MKTKISMYTRFERLWHWLQALLIAVLIVTGFEIHGTWQLLGFENACEVHNTSGGTLLILSVFAIFWHITTGEWKQYLPTLCDTGAVTRYYLVGMFRGESHPFRKTREQKLNPLQRLAYLSLKIILLPAALLSGLVYYYPEFVEKAAGGRLELVAYVHTAAAFALMVFFVMHTYLTTTGGTLLQYITAMITGWEKQSDSA